MRRLLPFAWVVILAACGDSHATVDAAGDADGQTSDTLVPIDADGGEDAAAIDAPSDAPSDADGSTEPDMDADVGTDADADSGTDAGTDSGTDTDTDTDTDTGTDAGTDADAGADTATGTDADADAARDASDGTMDADASGETCPGGCAADALCCPIRLGEHACVAVPAGEACPLPDLTVVADALTDSASVGWEFFSDAHCALVEACVGAPGRRRLLRFDTMTPNIGTADLVLGAADPSNPLFVYSECHGHYHFEGYATYRLLDLAGVEVGSGHKQAFCLLDFERYLETDPTVATEPRFTCEDQGIQRGWVDIYHSRLDCQWIDVTDVPPGDYRLVVSLNDDRVLPELDYDNNTVEIPVTIPVDVPADPTDACVGSELGPDRDCGFSVAAIDGSCNPGSDYEAGCGESCGLGDASACTGDPVLRVCPGSTPCLAHEALARDDDSCGEFCPRASFTCPASGQVTVLTGAYDPAASAVCAPTIVPSSSP